MAKGPRNEFIRRRAEEIIAEQELPPIRTIGEWRRAPDAREYARRYQVWELLAWYHHEVIRPELTLRAWLKRLWWRVSGQRVRLMSPWEQLAYRQRLEAQEKARAEATAGGDGS